MSQLPFRTGLSRAAFGAAALFMLSLASACGSEQPTTPVTVTKPVLGLVYLDISRNGRLDEGDPRLGGVTVALLNGGSLQPTATARTNAEGFFVAEDVPIGTYRVQILEGVLGDSLEIRPEISGQTFTITAQSADNPTNPTTTIALSYRLRNVAAVRRLPPGTRVLVDGVALNGPGLFGDASVHIRADSGSLRLTRVRSGVGARDSARFLGRVSMDRGQIVLDDVTPFRLGEVPLLTAVDITSGQIGTAAGGTLDAALVRVRGARILDIGSAEGDTRLLVDDGSGPALIVLDRDVGFDTQRYSVGQLLNATGLLVPLEDSPVWVLKPTARRDVVIVS